MHLKATSILYYPTLIRLDEVAEPVHTGQGSVFLNADNSDDDFTGSIGPTSQSVMEPQVITEGSTEASSAKTDANPDNFTTDTPELPDIFDSSTQLKEDNTERIESTPELPELPEESQAQSSDDTPEVPDIPSEAVIESSSSTTGYDYCTCTKTTNQWKNMAVAC